MFWHLPVVLLRTNSNFEWARPDNRFDAGYGICRKRTNDKIAPLRLIEKKWYSLFLLIKKKSGSTGKIPNEL